MTGPGPEALLSLAFLFLVLVAMGCFLFRKPFLAVMVLRLLRGHARSNLALLCAACISTAVISGALATGDSLEESIQGAAYDNLGEVDEVISSETLFNASLLDRLEANRSLMKDVDHLGELIYVAGTAENAGTGARTLDARIIGFDEDFLDFGKLVSRDGSRLRSAPAPNELFVNQKLADELSLRQGDRVNVSLPRLGQPFEAVFLGSQEESSLRVQLRVGDIVRDESLGRFQLNANRFPPMNLFVDIRLLQSLQGKENGANMLLVSNSGDGREGEELSGKVSAALERALDDALGLEDVGLGLEIKEERAYLALESEEVFFPYSYYETLARDDSLAGRVDISSVSTYFWDHLSFKGRQVPYSTVTGFDAGADESFGLFTVNGSGEAVSGELAPGEIIINNWTAERLQAGPGDALTMNFSVLDTFYDLQGREESFTVKYVVDMQGKAADPGLMPPFPGIEGTTSTHQWSPSFEIDLGQIGEEDEEYWLEFGGTPKAFLSLETADELWGTDIGNLTQLRFLPLAGQSLQELEAELEPALAKAMGREDARLTVKPVKSETLASSEGVGIFTGMFLAFSFGCILSALVLLALLVNLRVKARVRETGILRTLGLSRRQLRRVFLAEGLILSLGGGLLGLLAGLGFGFFLITGMNSFWSPTVGDAPVTFAVSADSLILGFVFGVLVSVFGMTLSLKWYGRWSIASTIRSDLPPKFVQEFLHPFLMLLPVLGFAMFTLILFPGGDQDFTLILGLGLGLTFLLAGLEGIFFLWAACRTRKFKTGQELRVVSRGWRGIAILAYTIIFVLIFYQTEELVTLFFVSGIMALTGLLLVFYHFLENLSREDDGKTLWWRPALESKRWLLSFSLRNAARHRDRTMSTVLLFSFTLFLLVGLTINLQGAVYDRDRAVSEMGGGYDIIGESTSPLFLDLGDKGSREEAGVYSPVFNDLTVSQFRTRGELGGTCSNLNPEASPRLIGAGRDFFLENRFNFVQHHELRKGEENPWLLLERDPDDGAIPAVGDYNTVVWILGLELGSTLEIEDEGGRVTKFEIVGIISNSILRGSLVILEDNFDFLYPRDPGYDLFLFESGDRDPGAQLPALEAALGDYGFDASTVSSAVEENIAVENSYITIFQSLLFLALLLGTLGLGIVVSRNVLEQQRELGLLRAMGFTRARLMTYLLMENAWMVLCGISMGVISGILASAVYLARTGSVMGSWPWFQLFGLVILSFVSAMTAVLVPVMKSSRLPVSEALRVYR